MKTILIIGNAKSIFIKEYIKHVATKEFDTIVLTCRGALPEEEKELYKNFDVKLVDLYQKGPVLSCIPKVANTIAFINNLKRVAKEYEIDTIQVHNVLNVNNLMFAYNALRQSCKRLILTYWGSDILDTDRTRTKRCEKLLEVTDIIILPTAAMREKFREYYGNKFDEKIDGVVFGNSIIQLAESMTWEKTPSDKIRIAIGYNANPRQQHIKVIDALGKLSDEDKEKIKIVLHMGYGDQGSDGYYVEVKQALEDNGLEGEIHTEFFNHEQVIEFRKAVDVYINAQITDALSASVMEYMYFGAIALNPTWLDYKEWRDLGIDYVDYEEFDEIPGIISKIVAGEIEISTEENRGKIAGNFTWTELSKKWRDKCFL